MGTRETDASKVGEVFVVCGRGDAIPLEGGSTFEGVRIEEIGSWQRFQSFVYFSRSLFS